MSRTTKKQAKICAFNLRQDLIDQIEKHAEKTYLSKTAIVELALEDYFARLNDTTTRVPDQN